MRTGKRIGNEGFMHTGIRGQMDRNRKKKKRKKSWNDLVPYQCTTQNSLVYMINVSMFYILFSYSSSGVFL